MKVGFISLGCAKNLVDTENMIGILKDGGFVICPDATEADVIIINTCAFIEAAKEEAITTILNMAECKENGNCRALIIAGCLGERYGKQLLEELPEADAIVGVGSWHRIKEAIDEALNGRKVVFVGEKTLLLNNKTPRVLTTPFYTAYVKIAEGCNHACAFCAIPLIRGKMRSRPIDDVVSEVTALVAGGVREINLIAQDTTGYGRDLYGSPALVRLLKEIVKVEGDFWVRIMYSYPQNFSDELIDLIAAEPKICKYVDLPLQHAHDSVLKNMRRSDRRANIETLLKKIRERIPLVAVRSSFIVGFPGETAAQYQALRDFVEEQCFDKMGVFAFSREEGTPAYDMSGQVPPSVIEERYHDLMSLQSKISEDINVSLEGKELSVLIEGNDDELPVAVGRSMREAPEVDGKIYVENVTAVRPGDIIRVKITQGFAYDAIGEPI